MRPLILLLAAMASASATQGADPVDSILQSYWAAHGVTIPAPVSDAVFARRAYLDVWGFVPTPAQLGEFSADRRPDKRRLLVEQLLANRRNYSEHWVSFWNDLLRNDEGSSITATGRPSPNGCCRPSKTTCRTIVLFRRC